MHKLSLQILVTLALAQPLIGNESLTLKRIQEFWKDEAFDQAKSQLLQFLAQYPDSQYRDNAYAMLGDLHLKEGSLDEAIAAYDQIIHRDVLGVVQSNYLQALLQKEDYTALLNLAEKTKKTGATTFLTAEALFRLGKKASDLETQKNFYIQAASHYETLKTPTLSKETLWPLAEIYKALGEHAKAAELYQQLAGIDSANSESFLFQAAVLQSHSDKAAAIKTFEELYNLKGADYSSAAYNHLILLFEEKNYTAFVKSYAKMHSDLPIDKAPLLTFYAGESHFKNGEIEEAITLLKDASNKPGLLLLVACAEKKGDLQLLENTTKLLVKEFPSDKDTAEALLLNVRLSCLQGDSLQAQKHLEYVLEVFPDHPERENLLWEYGILLSTNTLWQKSNHAFETLLKEYPQTPFKADTWRHLMDSAAKEGDRERFTSLLGAALNEPGVFEGSEENHYQILWIKLLLEQRKSAEAAQALTHYLDKNPESAEGHLLTALISEHNPELFTFHAEKALTLDPHMPTSGELHLKLYNIYIESPATQDNAAHHLFTLVQEGAIPVKGENLRWLAHHYFEKREEGGSRAKALFLHEKLVTDPLTPSIEKEILHYADLLGIENRLEQKISLLERLSEQQYHNADLSWGLQRQTLFELGKAYAQNQEAGKAIATYSQLIATSTHIPSYFSRAATLEKARLQYSLLSTEQKEQGNAEVEEILNALKDLQVGKKLHSEPLHLEAALDYISILAQMEPEDKRDDKTLFLLRRAKKDFTEKNGIPAKDYQSQRDVLPEKAKTLATYLLYIDAEILRLEGKDRRAEKLYHKIQENPLDPSLSLRIKRSMEVLYDAR